MSTQPKGIYSKYNVSRRDRRDQPGGDREHAHYFVLDLVYDPFAREALKYYAFKCAAEYPELAADLWRMIQVINKAEGNFEEEVDNPESTD